MRCAVAAPAKADLRALYRTLDASGVEIVPTSELGAGAALAQSPLETLDCAIAVIPPTYDERSGGFIAVYVEIGILVGRGLPLMIIASPPNPPSPALANIRSVYTDLENQEALDFQVNLFLASIPASPVSTSARRAAPKVNLKQYREYFQSLRGPNVHSRAKQFEQGVEDLLRDCGAVVEARRGADSSVDIAAYLPGYEQSLGPFVVEVKSNVLGPKQYWDALTKLSAYVLNSRSGLGVLIYDSLTDDASKVGIVPLVMSLGVDDLLSQLEEDRLGQVLQSARNRAIHGI